MVEKWRLRHRTYHIPHKRPSVWCCISPGCANFGLKKIANGYEAEFGSAATDFVKRYFYVDDGLASVPTVEEAINLIIETKGLCVRGGLHLHKFVSNSRAVLDTVAVEDRAKGITNLDLSHNALPIEKCAVVHQIRHIPISYHHERTTTD